MPGSSVTIYHLWAEGTRRRDGRGDVFATLKAEPLFDAEPRAENSTQAYVVFRN